MNRIDIYQEINSERMRQRDKWSGLHDWGTGDASSAYVPMIVKLAILMEEVGEVARAVLDKQPESELKEELVQVASVCVAILEGLDA